MFYHKKWKKLYQWLIEEEMRQERIYNSTHNREAFYLAMKLNEVMHFMEQLQNDMKDGD